MITEQRDRPICSNCGRQPCMSEGTRTILGFKIYKKFCTRCWKMRYRRDYKYKIARIDVCQRCGFIPEDLCQLDVHHMDGDHENNNLTNLITLCANCHRLYTCKKIEQ